MYQKQSILSCLPNLLSLARIPLALFFFSDSLILRFLALFLAGCTDAADGYLARKLHVNSSWGRIIDPLADKFFAAITFSIMWIEGSLNLPQLFALFTREVALLGFALLLYAQGEWKGYRIHAIWSGKLLTMLQGTILLFLIFQQPVSFYAYLSCFLLGVMTFVELFYERFTTKSLTQSSAK